MQKEPQDHTKMKHLEMTRVENTTDFLYNNWPLGLPKDVGHSKNKATYKMLC